MKQVCPFPKTIIFCRTKAVAGSIYYFLRARVPRGMVSMFHAKLTTETKNSLFREYSSTTSRLRCLIATIAFGMVSYILID